MSYAPSEYSDASKPKPRRSSKHVREVEAEGLYLWNIAKSYLTRPLVAGGLFGIVNIGLVAFVGRKFYRYPHLRRDAITISSSFAACIGLMTAEGYAATKYRHWTPQGQEEQNLPKRGLGTVIFHHIDSLGGKITCLVNTVMIGAVGYWSYLNWNNKPWDPCVVSAVSVGLLALLSGEGFLAWRKQK